jgi:hypothetical protein
MSIFSPCVFPASKFHCADFGISKTTPPPSQNPSDRDNARRVVYSDFELRACHELPLHTRRSFRANR